MSASLALDFRTQLRPEWMGGERLTASKATAHTGHSGLDKPGPDKSAVDELGLDSIVADALKFFAARTKQAAKAGSPYIAHGTDDQPGLALQEFVAKIRVSGRHRATVLISASRAMLTIMLMRMGATDITVDTMRGALGELASAIGSSIRLRLGDEVLAGTPVVSVTAARLGTPTLESSRAPLVAPIHWRNYTASIALNIE